MTWMITGGTGLVGNNVVRRLLELGRQVRVLVRRADDPALAGLDVEMIEGDVRDADIVSRACRGATHVVHAAALVHIGWTGGEAQQQVNVQGTLNVARGAREAGARMVHVSSVDALGLGSPEAPADELTPLADTVPCPYVLSKRGAERVIADMMQEGLAAVVVNPAYMLGPWDWKPSSGRMLLQVARGWARIAPPGGNSFCDVRDVAEATIAAGERGALGRNFILAGHSLSYRKAWTIFARVAGTGAPLVTPPGPLAMLIAGRAGDLLTRIRGREGDVNSAAIRLATLPRFYSSARAEAELGYRRRSVETTVADAWEWFCEHGYTQSRGRYLRRKLRVDS